VKLGQQGGFNLFELTSNPLLVFIGKHRSNYKGNDWICTNRIAGAILLTR
jgi:hypothetical protein